MLLDIDLQSLYRREIYMFSHIAPQITSLAASKLKTENCDVTRAPTVKNLKT